MQDNKDENIVDQYFKNNNNNKEEAAANDNPSEICSKTVLRRVNSSEGNIKTAREKNNLSHKLYKGLLSP